MFKFDITWFKETQKKPDPDKIVLVACEHPNGPKITKYGDQYLQTLIGKWTGTNWVFMATEWNRANYQDVNTIRYWAPWPVFFLPTTKTKTQLASLFKEERKEEDVDDFGEQNFNR